MVAPVVAAIAVGVGVQVVSGLYQAYQAERRGRADKKKMDEIEAAFDNLMPPDFDGSIMSPPEQILAAPRSPNFTTRNLTREDFQVIGQFTPEVAPYIAESRPDLVKDSAAGGEGKDGQMIALR